LAHVSNRGWTIRGRLLLVLIPLIILLFSLFIAVVYPIGRATLREQLKTQTYYTGRSVLEPFDLLFTGAGEIADQLAVAVAASPSLRDDFLRKLIRGTLENNPEIFGSAVAFAPAMTPLGSYAAYYHRTATGIRYLSLLDPKYDYQRQSWFQTPLANGVGGWSEPYWDRGGGDIVMVTYSTPIRGKQQRIGVATVDVALETLVAKIRALQPVRGGYAFLMTRENRLLAHPYIEARSLSAASGEIGSGKGVPQFASFLSALGRVGPSDDASKRILDPFSGQWSWVTHVFVRSAGWTLFLVYPERELLSPWIGLMQKLLIAAGGFILLLVILIFWVTASVSDPLQRLVRRTEQYAEGDFSGSVDESPGTAEIRSLSRAFNIMGRKIASLVQNLRHAQEEIVHRLALASEYRDTDTGKHIQRVGLYAEILARANGFTEEECFLVREAAPMHDVGKIGVPDAILLKPDQLDLRERQVIKTHTLIGNDILTGGTSPLVRLAQDIAATHHERWDGTGYPKGLQKEEISVAGKIVALCDVFDALISRRPYKQAFSFEDAVAEIRKGRGNQFDPQLTDLFMQVLPKIKEVLERFPPS